LTVVASSTGNSRDTVWERRTASRCAVTRGANPRSAIERSMVERVAAATSVRPLRTRLTVDTDTPARAATSMMVGPWDGPTLRR
jgi:hypothetical protein